MKNHDVKMGSMKLGCKRNESIHIGDDIKITYTGNKYGQVQITVEAPRSVSIDRSSVLRKKKETDRQLKEEFLKLDQ